MVFGEMRSAVRTPDSSPYSGFKESGKGKPPSGGRSSNPHGKTLSQHCKERTLWTWSDSMNGFNRVPVLSFLRKSGREYLERFGTGKVRQAVDRDFSHQAGSSLIYTEIFYSG